MTFTRTHFLALVSPARGPKPETVVFAEADSVRERIAAEVLHFHEAGKTTCKICGRTGFMIWTDSESTFERDGNRCGNLPHVEVELT